MTRKEPCPKLRYIVPSVSSPPFARATLALLEGEVASWAAKTP